MLCGYYKMDWNTIFFINDTAMQVYTVCCLLGYINWHIKFTISTQFNIIYQQVYKLFKDNWLQTPRLDFWTIAQLVLELLHTY